MLSSLFWILVSSNLSTVPGFSICAWLAPPPLDRSPRLQWGTGAKCGLSTDQLLASLCRCSFRQSDSNVNNNTTHWAAVGLRWISTEKTLQPAPSTQKIHKNNTYQQHLKNITEIISNERRQKQRIPYSVILFISNSRISKLTYGTRVRLGAE